ncbi:hypothetical protein PDJAM_G00211810 [Pangasius djambal]|uniref:Uncharacterized protein n=1 Tax=Pangasius djambal TaxID=1691987 RepID=A0ACC5Y9X4_9TELE|nr:hypothetical protein [Pangasius djambal]
MESKIIYFTVNGRPEQAEFPIDCPAQDVKDLFRSAAEAGPHDILKLYNPKGNIINISPQLTPNSPHTCYKLEVVAADCNSEPLGTELTVSLGFDLSSMEKRLQSLEKKILIESGKTPAVVYEMKQQVESFREKLESVEHLSWLGLFKEMSEGTHKPSPFYHKRTLRKTREECEHVKEKFFQMSSLEVSEEVRQYLKTPTFDNWQWEDAEIMVLLQVMYTDLDFISTFNIELDVLQHFLYEVYKRYNNIPFHNFKHCFCVTQMMYGLIWLTDLRAKIDSIDLLIMLTSAVCHDLDHTGYNNAYQINARTELALRYNDISPLENHHCAVAFEILEKTESNIFRNLTTDQYKRIREGIIKCILATDMSRHTEILNKFKAILPVFDFSNKDHRDVPQISQSAPADPCPQLKRIQWSWAREHQNWTTEQWRKVAWSDESRFLLHHLDGRVRVRHLPGEEMAPGCTMGSRQAVGGSVMRWVIFCLETFGHGIHVDVTLTCTTYLNIVEDQYTPSWQQYSLMAVALSTE